MQVLEVAQQVQQLDAWRWVERSSWVVGILLALVPAIVAIASAIRARSGRRRGATGDRTVEGNTFGDNASINQGDIVTTQVLLYQPHVVKEVTQQHTTTVTTNGPDAGGGNDNTWGLILVGVVVGLAMIYLYLTYREWALGFTAGVVAMTLLSCLITVALVRGVAGRGVNVGLVLNLGAVVAASALLYHLWTRTTPYGDYDSLERLVHNEGWVATLFAQRAPTGWFIMLEIFALAYLVIAMLTINRYQIGVVAALAAARRVARGIQRSPSWFVRNWAPESRFQLFGGPLIVIVLVGVGWLISSVWSFELLQQLLNHPVQLPGVQPSH